MNRQLIIIPTLAEAKLLISALNMLACGPQRYTLKDKSTDLLLCGPGIPASMFNTMRLLSSETYDKILLSGIAGSYDENLTAGSLVCVESEQFADIGVHDEMKFNSLCTHTEWADPYHNGKIINPNRDLMMDTQLPLVTSNTVNLNNMPFKGVPTAAIENMEGAGLFMIFNEMKIPFLEIRSVSNQVRERNKSKWDIHLALDNLTDYLIEKFTK